MERPRSADDLMMRARRLLLPTLLALGLATGSVAVSAESASVVDASLSGGATAVQRASRVQAPTTSGFPSPRVFMAFHGMNQVANNNSLDGQWRYVQDNLDGFWGNNAAISGAEIARLVRKADTRQLINESEFNGSFFVETYDYVERIDRSIDFNREAVTFYTAQPGNWNGKTISDARRAVTNARYGSGDDRYGDVFTGWQPQNFYTDRVRQYPPIPGASSAERAVFAGDGVFVECPNDVCNGVEYEDGFFRAMRIARQTGQQFVWLASRPPGSPQSGWLAEFQTMYRRVADEGLWRDDDVIVVIAYGAGYPIVPESRNGQAADTTMGLMYWALQQS